MIWSETHSCTGTSALCRSVGGIGWGIRGVEGWVAERQRNTDSPVGLVGVARQPNQQWWAKTKVGGSRRWRLRSTTCRGGGVRGACGGGVGLQVTCSGALRAGGDLWGRA